MQSLRTGCPFASRLVTTCYMSQSTTGGSRLGRITGRIDIDPHGGGKTVTLIERPTLFQSPGPFPPLLLMYHYCRILLAFLYRYQVRSISP